MMPGDQITLGQAILGAASAAAAVVAGFFTFRSTKLVQDTKREEQASQVLLRALKDEREALEAERARAEALRKERNASDDETHDCERELRVVRGKIERLEAHSRACDQLRKEFDEFRSAVGSSHTNGSPAE
jgi:predicted nuclease with TOPRIM domain